MVHRPCVQLFSRYANLGLSANVGTLTQGPKADPKFQDTRQFLRLQALYIPLPPKTPSEERKKRPQKKEEKKNTLRRKEKKNAPEEGIEVPQGNLGTGGFGS